MSFIAHNLKILRSKKGYTIAEMGDWLDVPPSTYSSYEYGKSEPKADILVKICEIFGTDVAKFISTDLTDAHLTDSGKDTQKQHLSHLNAHGNTLLKGKKGDQKASENVPFRYVSEPNTPYISGAQAPKVITVNERGDENIVYVPVKARAGYLIGYGDPEFMSTLPTYRLPGLTNGTYRMFEVDGPSMAPNIQHGDRVIGQWVDRLSDIVQNRVYVVVTRSGVIVKRLLNRLDQRGKIVIKSDTINYRGDFPTLEIDPEEILEIWYCRIKLSSDFSEPAEIYHRVADLEADMVEVKQIISHFSPLLPQIKE